MKVSPISVSFSYELVNQFCLFFFFEGGGFGEMCGLALQGTFY